MNSLSSRRLRITAVFACLALALTSAAAADMNGPGNGKLPKPTGLAVTSTTTTLTLSWDAVSGASGYSTYLGNSTGGATTGTSWTFAGLKCGTTHLLQVDAFDRKSHHSVKAGINGTTATCEAPPAPVISGFTPSSGKVGTAITVNGSSFTGATKVAFNGTAATFTVANDNQITTSAPSAATTGPITVTACRDGEVERVVHRHEHASSTACRFQLQPDQWARRHERDGQRLGLHRGDRG